MFMDIVRSLTTVPVKQVAKIANDEGFNTDTVEIERHMTVEVDDNEIKFSGRIIRK